MDDYCFVYLCDERYESDKDIKKALNKSEMRPYHPRLLTYFMDNKGFSKSYEPKDKFPT